MLDLKVLIMNLFSQVDALYQKYVSVLQDVCNIESPTDFKEGVDKVGNYFAALSQELGFSVERFAQPLSGDVLCITMNKDAKGEPIAFSGHIDTVHKIGLFGYPPTRINDGKIYGPGVVDCKGGIVAGFMAMEALKNIGFKDRPIMMLLQTDEEVGSRLSNKATINYICEKAKSCIAFLNLEGYSDNYVNKAVIARKGILRFEIKVTGVEAHSSGCALSGSNAIVEAAHKIIEIDKIKDNDGVTCNCGVIKGGSVANTVPGECSFVVDVRIATAQQGEWIKNRLREITDTVYVKGCSSTIELVSYRVAMGLEDRNVALLDRMNEIFRKNGLSLLEKAFGRGGSDAADVSSYGIPCVDTVGLHGNYIHSVKEEAYLDSLKDCAKRLAIIAYSL